MSTATKTVTYRVEYRYPHCYDDGSPAHDELWSTSSAVLKDCTSKKEAQLAMIDENPNLPWRQKEHCYHGRTARPVHILVDIHEETVGGWVRDRREVVPIPVARRCVCQKLYWPIKGESACHKVVPIEKEQASA